MGALSQLDILQTAYGPYTNEIYGFEPMIAEGVIPEGAGIPTHIEMRTRTPSGLTDVFIVDQQLDDEGRLEAVRLNGERNPTLTRSYKDPVDAAAFTDAWAGNQRTVTVSEDNPNKMVVTEANGDKITVETETSDDGSEMIKIKAPEGIYTITKSREGKTLEEVFTPTVFTPGDLYNEGFWEYPVNPFEEPPQPAGRRWSFLGDQLVEVVSPNQGAILGGTEIHDKSERYRATLTGDIEVTVYQSPELIELEESRKYNTSYRLETVERKVYIPTSGEHEMKIELTYED